MRSLPPAFAAQMKDLLGNAFQDFEAGLQTPSPTSVRYHPKKVGQLPEVPQVPWCAQGRYLSVRPEFAHDPWWHAGAYYVQEAGSMFTGHAVTHLLQDVKQPVVLDLCAAPGGKSTHLASILGNKGLLVSNEVVKARLGVLQENLMKWGFNNSVITQNDPSHFSALDNFFDLVVVDAPCSGEGLFRRQPEAMEEWSEQQVEFCAARQHRILEDVWPAIKPGGYLVYSTCTYNRIENEGTIQWLQSQEEAVGVEIPVSEDWNIAVEQHGRFTSYRFYPHRTQSEGFFLTVLQKPEEGFQSPYLASKHTYFKKPSREDQAKLVGWVTRTAPLFMTQRNGRINLLPTHFYEEIEYLARKLHVVYAGTEVGEIKGKDANPAQGLANSVVVNRAAFSTVALDLDQALRYLARLDMDLEGPLGLQLATYEGIALGWYKQLPNRINNYYPAEWRFRTYEKK